MVEKEKQKKLLDEYNAGLIKQAEEQDKQWLKLQELTTSRTEFEKTQLQVKYDQEIAAAEGNAELQKALTTKDEEDIKVAVGFDADYIAVSFPRSADDINTARSLIEAAKGNGAIGSRTREKDKRAAK